MSEFVRWLSRYDYAELRIEKGQSTRIQIKDGEIRPNVGSFFGASVRVLQNGSWGFASTSKPETDFKTIIEDAARLARLTAGDIRIPESPILSKKITHPSAASSLEETLHALHEAQVHADAPHLKNRTLTYNESSVSHEFYNAHGSEILEERFHAYFSCQCVAREGGNLQKGHSRVSSTRRFNDLPLAKTCSDAAQKAERMLKAAPPPRGRFTVILDNEMTGVFSHEAVGHACEGDSILERESILRDKLGARIGNELVTIIDNPVADGAAEGFGRYAYDEEGIAGQPSVLVEKGVLKGYLHSRETAHELHHAPNGHARAMDHAHPPVVRMSNTYFQPGPMPRDELFDVPSAIYVKGMKGGSVDIFAGNFMFKAEEAYEVKKGRIGRLLRDVTLTGNILETLHSVEAVADDFATNPGYCGKMGQDVPVSDGGPHIRVKNVALG